MSILLFFATAATASTARMHCVHGPTVLVSPLAERNGTTSYPIKHTNAMVACTHDELAGPNSTLLRSIAVPVGSTLFLLEDAVANTSAPHPHGEVYREGRSSLRLVNDEEAEDVILYSRKIALSVVFDHPRQVVGDGPAQKGAACPLSIRATLANNVDEVFYRKVLSELSGEVTFTLNGRETRVKTRYSGTVGNVEAGEYLADLCASLGYEVEEQVFAIRTGMQGKNIICIKRGKSGRVVVVGGHYDSTSQSATTSAPGAIDNGSGSLGVLAIAAAVSTSKLDFEQTVHFVFFGGEEQGLYGSKHYVQVATASGLQIETALITDMIGYSSKFYGVIIEGTNTPASLKLMEEAEEDYQIIAPNLQLSTTTVSFGSDHVPFQQAGIPCYLAIEMDDTDYPGYHKTSDTIAYMDWGQAMDILKGMAGTLCRRAGLA